MRYCLWQFGHSTYRRVVDIGYVQPRAPAKLSLQAYPALKILYVWHRTITETPMVHTKRPYLSSQTCQGPARSASRRASWLPRPACLEAGQIQTILPSAPEWCRGKVVRQGKASRPSLAEL